MPHDGPPGSFPVQTPYLKQVRAEQYEAGRAAQRQADVEYLRAMADGLRSEVEDVLATEQVYGDTAATIRTVAATLDMVADNIEKGESRRG